MIFEKERKDIEDSYYMRMASLTTKKSLCDAIDLLEEKTFEIQYITGLDMDLLSFACVVPIKPKTKDTEEIFKEISKVFNIEEIEELNKTNGEQKVNCVFEGKRVIFRLEFHTLCKRVKIGEQVLPKYEYTCEEA